MSRFARYRRVFFFEEPVYEPGVQSHLRSKVCPETGVVVVTPVLPDGLNHQAAVELQKSLLESLLAENAISEYVAWYYTPMAIEFSTALRPKVTVYDCMDELSAFAGAPPAMRLNEALLFQRAGLVFTGGVSLYESKRKQHNAVYAFPSSVDVAHFAKARSIDTDPADQAGVPRPRFGYAGVIDERMDVELLAAVAKERPNYHFVLLGPVVKIDPARLPSGANLHYLGMKAYADLPAYMSGWTAGILPFALNESTRFISPTKTPEYLAAGLHVISTPIRDVVTPYGDLALVQIASSASEFLRAADSCITSPFNEEFRSRVDRFLAQSSWDKTWSDMNKLIEERLEMNELASRSKIGSLIAKGAANV